MRVDEAKRIAREWVAEQGSRLPGFLGAFLHGSINDLTDDAPLPATSDVDVMVVLDGPEPTAKLGKLRYERVLLEVSYLPRQRVESAEQVLADYPLAGSFRGPSVLADPSGHLSAVQAAVSRDFANEVWVRRRCEGARDNALRFLGSLREDAPLHEQVPPWLFGTGVTTHVLLVAGLRNPTVRRRYVAARELLSGYGLLAFHEELLAALGCAGLSAERIASHLPALSAAFDAAGSVLRTPYPFAADMMPDARPVAIDGSRELIEQGLHREAVFWMVAVYSRCQWVLAHDAPADVQSIHTAGYRALLADLGMASYAELQAGIERTHRFLPRVWDVAEAIIAANPGIG